MAISKYTVIVMSFAFASFSGAAFAQSKWMSAAQIKQEIIGKSFSFVGRSSGTVSYDPGGTVASVSKKFGKLSGKWWFKGSKWCRIYSKWPKRTRCLGFQKLANGKYRTSNGATLTPK